MRAGVAITHRDRLPSSSRYELLVKIASGGMATVYVGRLNTVVGTSRLVAIKRAHAHLLEDPAFGKMLIAEAKLASRIHHPNVVAVQTVEELEGELLLVMDYVEGASLADLWAYEEVPVPARVAVRSVLDACAGLQAAHELTDDDGRPLGIVHRDVSPHNILVGVDGIARLTDFGIAKSSGGHTGSAGAQTSTGALKGKVAYMAPEYVESGKLDPRSDVFALGIVLWEALTRTRLFRGANEVESLRLVLATQVPRPSEVAPWVGGALDEVVLKALARSPGDRFASASDLADALERAARKEDLIATASQVGTYVKTAAGEGLARRRALIRQKSDESTTANAKFDAETRAALASARNLSARDAGPESSPFGRNEQTSSLAADSPEGASASEVRVRDSHTAPLSPLSEPALSSIERQAVTARVPEGGTAGSGVSAGLVEDARVGARGRSRGWFVALALVAAVGIAGAALAMPYMRASTSSSTTIAPPRGAVVPSAVAAPTNSSTTTAIPSSAMSTPAAPREELVVASALGPSAAPPSASVAPGGPVRPRGTRPFVVVPAVTARKPPAAPAEPLPPDRAPPNPYAH